MVAISLTLFIETTDPWHLSPTVFSSILTQLPLSLGLVELLFRKCDLKCEQIGPHPVRREMVHFNRVTENLRWGHSQFVGRVMDTNEAR